MTTPNGAGLSFVPVSISNSGDNVVIPASGKGIFVRRVVLALAAQTTVQFKAGSRVLSGPQTLTELGLGFSDQAYYVCDPGEDFIISLGASISCGGTIWFQYGPQ